MARFWNRRRRSVVFVEGERHFIVSLNRMKPGAHEHSTHWSDVGAWDWIVHSIAASAQERGSCVSAASVLHGQFFTGTGSVIVPLLCWVYSLF